MNDSDNSLPILMYYNIRGKLQSIRYQLFHMNIKFMEIHLYDEQEKKKLPQKITNLLKKEKIEPSQLPLLIHQEKFVYGIYPIMAYLCRRYKQFELLGRDIKQKARLQETLEITLSKQCNCMMGLFKFSQKVENMNQADIMKQKAIFFESLIKQFSYIFQICQYIQKNENPSKTFVLKEITLIDFIVLETFTYIVGFLGDIVKQSCALGEIFRNLLKIKQNDQFPLKHLKTMKNYLLFASNQPFYIENKEYLESFSILCGQFSQIRKKWVQKIWTLNKKFVS